VNPSADEHSELALALEQQGIDMPAQQLAQLDRYRRALWDWNEKLNLTRHTTVEKFVQRDVVDSLALEPFLEPGQRVLDVGTGGGVPGMILAIVRPDLAMTLSESVAKRARAAEAIRDAAGVEAIVVHARAEQLLDDQVFDSVIARAVAPLAKILRWFEPHWDAIGQLLLIKGPAWVDERHGAREAGLLGQLELRRLVAYPIPGSDSQSVVLRVRQQQ
jgi:16S rRNA (guanine527-N7)-methyltransferase